MEEQRYDETRGLKVATLREGAVQAASSSSEQWFADTAEVLASCQVLDATEAFSYFWDETPNEQTFEMEDIPQIGLPEPLMGSGRGSQALFVEADAPAKGLGWSLLLEGRGTADNEELARINSVAYPKGAATAAVGTDPGAVVIEPGLVERAGALLYFDQAPSSKGARRFYERLAGPEEVEQWSAVVQAFPFARLDAAIYGEAVLAPQVIYYMPLDGDRRVKPVGAGKGLPMVIPGLDPETSGGETIGRVLGRGHRALHLALLFSLACAGARQGHRHALPQLRTVGEDSCGAVHRVRMSDRMGDLKRTLNDSGAESLGLSHALTVCRDEFGPDTGHGESRASSRE